MTKSELVIYICKHYGHVMLLTHDELMHINKLGLEQYLADLQKEYKTNQPKYQRQTYKYKEE